MDLKYDVYTITNAEGSGEERKYVRLKQHEAMTASELEATIQQRCTLTKGDVAAVFTELHDIVVSEFSMGRRVYVPKLGYFSLAVNLEVPEDNPDKKITGKEVRLRGINFRPEAGLLQEIDRNVHFIRSEYTGRSNVFTEKKLWTVLQEFFQENRYLTISLMRMKFGLSRHMAQKWIDHFIDKGLLVKDGSPRSPIYFLNDKQLNFRISGS